MKILTLVGFVTLFATPVWAQSYSAPPAQLPPQPQSQLYDPYAQQPAMQPGEPGPYQGQPAYDPNQDYDADIDGYDAEYDMRYDDQAAQEYDDGYDPNAYQQFESSLAPYGQWVDDSSYGHVWVPSQSVVGTDFTPYASSGHWVLSEYGWTWVSDWDWGWAPFHYGRWVCGLYGWSWVPGSVWGPAWVSWRSGGGYVGWAPLPPRGVVVGPPHGVRSPWRFVVANQLAATRPSFLPAHTVPTVFGRTTVVSNARSLNIGAATVRVNAGPTSVLAGGGVGVSSPARLSVVAPHVVPRINVVPHTGVAYAARPWVRAGVTSQVPFYAAPRTSIPIGPQHAVPPTYRSPIVVPARPATNVRPSYQAPHGYYNAPAWGSGYTAAPMRAYAAPAPYRAPTYSAPAYSAPTQYSAPMYHTPAYSAPAYHYSAPAAHYAAPTYHSAPATHYSAPTFQSAPSRSSSSFSHGFSGGGHRR
jgi:hypothetical protein